MKISCALLAFTAALSVHAAEHAMISSKTMYAMNVALTSRYQQMHPAVRFRVTDSGTGKAIEGLAAGTIDVAAVTREPRAPEEKEFIKRYRHAPVVFPIALEGISVFMHPRNRVDSITVDQFSRIMAGEIRNWKEVGGTDLPIHVYSFDNTTGRYWYVQEQLLGKKAFAKDAQYTRAPAGSTPAAGLAAEQDQMLHLVSNDPAAIGYGDLKKVRIVKVARIVNGRDAFWPTPADIQSGHYPLVRRLMLMLRDKPAGELADFVQWCQMQTDLVRQYDFVPLGN